MRRYATRGWTLAATLLSLGLHATPAMAATKWRVQNWGVDGLGCGLTVAATPCRSISDAITKASAGDTILVGPGIYSDDLDGDGVYGEAGEETTPIKVNKPMTVVSTHGAQGTLIAMTQTLLPFAVSLEATTPGRTTFGALNKGFTVAVRNGWRGILAQPQVVGSRTTIAGNIVVMSPFSEPTLPASTVGITYTDYGMGSGVAVIKDNQVIGYGNSDADVYPSIGIVFSNSSTTTKNLVDHNAVSNCNIGFYVGGGTWTVTNNSAVANHGDGSNNGFGFYFYSTTLKSFARNTASANTTGISVHGVVTFTSQEKNVMVGNLSNCGFENVTAAALDFPGNFWGGAGPGADPADNFCDEGPSTTTTAPNATVDTSPKMRPRR